MTECVFKGTTEGYGAKTFRSYTLMMNEVAQLNKSHIEGGLIEFGQPIREKRNREAHQENEDIRKGAITKVCGLSYRIVNGSDGYLSDLFLSLQKGTESHPLLNASIERIPSKYIEKGVKGFDDFKIIDKYQQFAIVEYSRDGERIRQLWECLFMPVGSIPIPQDTNS